MYLLGISNGINQNAVRLFVVALVFRRGDWLEGLALQEALTCCIAKGNRCVLCKSGSLQLIRALNEEAPISEVYGIVSAILNLVFAFDYVSFVWIQQTENKAADALAKQTLLDEAFVPALMNFGA
ncbi:hypothetical protein Bca4012_014455 [Brassica carinata]